MNLTEWLRYLESFPSGFTNRSLEIVQGLAQKLGVLKFPGQVITVAGTNGKGSTVVFLESILLAAGFTTGAYISPHLLDYRERIRLNGVAVDETILCQALAVVEKASSDFNLSYFEFSTLAALVIFQQRNLDVLILEVGLGGRFDAVNIIDSDISVVTTIAFDHTHILGDTREAIGYEKAGIIRGGKPIVVGANMPTSVYAVADKLQAPLYALNRDFFYSVQHEGWSWRGGEKVLENLPLPQLPINSAALALMVIELLKKWEKPITKDHCVVGLNHAFLRGRLQRLVFNGREIILDVAHNHEAAELLAFNLARDKTPGRVLAVVSMLKDKDIVASLSPLVGVVDQWYVGVLKGERAASVGQLSESLQQAGGRNFVLFPGVLTAFTQAIAESQEKDKIVAFGSFHTVAEILKLVLEENKT